MQDILEYCADVAMKSPGERPRELAYLVRSGMSKAQNGFIHIVENMFDGISEFSVL